jgi:crotonobetainyl-CoA:carnitine CoA-transferase CaiB-like acyl-CoA transferase
MTRVLEGTVVLDLTRFLSGPQCTLLLAGLGAEVIKVDDPAVGDPTVGAPPLAGREGMSFSRRAADDYGLAYLKRARGKKSITLNLKHLQGRKLFLALVEKADVLVENFRVGVTRRLGIDYEPLAGLNERLVYCSLTGYGATGPDKALKAYDLMIQAATGLMSITGPPGAGPVKAGSPLSDTIAGALAALGVVSALHQRSRTGRGQFVDVSMADCLMSMVWDEPLDCYAQLGLDPRQGNRIMRFSPFNTYPTSDGWIAIGAATHEEWCALLDVMERPELREHPELSRVGWRIENNEAIDQLVGEWAKRHTTEHLLSRLAARDICCSPVRNVTEVLEWPQVKARETLVPLRRPDGTASGAVGPGFPLKFSDAATDYAPSPVPGAHTAEVLSRFLGIDGTELERLRASGAV